jgi:hypothetical protein
MFFYLLLCQYASDNGTSGDNDISVYQPTAGWLGQLSISSVVFLTYIFIQLLTMLILFLVFREAVFRMFSLL